VGKRGGAYSGIRKTDKKVGLSCRLWGTVSLKKKG